MTTHRLRATALAGLAGIVGIAAVVAGPIATAAAPTTEIKPPTLEKGDPGYVPHVDGDGLLVGDSRYDFDGREVRFLGYAGKQLNHYVVGVYRGGKPKSHRVIQVQPDDARRVVLRGVSVPDLVLSSDGEQLFRSIYRPREQRTVVRTWSTKTGKVIATPTFAGYADVLDAFDGTAVLGASMPDRTFSWKIGSGATTRIVDRNGYVADVRHNRLASIAGDIYAGGCSVVSTITKPRKRLWRSCHQAVVTFSPSGERLVTTHLLTDGLGSGELQLRESTGKHLRSFTTYYFGQVWWEADEVLLMHAHGRKKSAWVRCEENGDCVRTSRLRRTDG